MLLLAAAGVGLVLQRRTIADLRSQPEATSGAAPAEQPPAQAAEPPQVAAQPQPPDISKSAPAQEAHPQPVDSREIPQNAAIDVTALQKQNAQLAEQLRMLQEQLSQTKLEPPAPSATTSNLALGQAYVGPGTWVQVASDPARVQLPPITISAGGQTTLNPGDPIPGGPMTLQLGDKPPVPFYLLSRYSPTPAYQTGIAAIENETTSIYLLVTFQPQGLKVDFLRPSRVREAHSLHWVVNMVRSK